MYYLKKLTSNMDDIHTVTPEHSGNQNLIHSHEHPLLIKEGGIKSWKGLVNSNSRCEKTRAVCKNGDCNTYPLGVSKKQFIKDTFTTLVDLRWRWTITFFVLGFFLTWMIFAIAWWLVLDIHGDFEEAHLPPHQKASNWTPCVTEMYGFTSCFLFSVETQYTTGYGMKAPTDECLDAITLMCIQNIVGLVIQAFLVGIVFAKLTRPKLRAQTLKFSKYAVVCKRNGEMHFMFRIGDMRQRSRLIEAKLKCQLILPVITKEGESLKNHLKKLSVSVDDCEGDLFLIWPMVVTHKIDEKSPFYRMCASDLSRASFEVIIALEGTIESTDQKTQARTSYLPCEIIWGHTFEPMIRPGAEKGGYTVDYTQFDNLIITDTPSYSAEQLKERERL